MENLLIVSNLILWVLVIGLGVTVLALARQVGVLYERIAPAGALMVIQGPAVGELAPQFDLETVSGETIVLGGLSSAKKSTLLFFLSPTCPVCNTLIPILKSIQHSESKWLEIVFASDGDLGTQQAFIAKKEISSFPYVLSTQLGIAYQVAKLPFAVLVDENGVLRAKGLTNNREHLESLFSAMEHGVSSIQEFMSNRQQGAA
ncbi:MAG: methylamine dehydrogenase accessory protein MauD [Gammaproteobacteria bacterium]|jgi:methylamine dehydrogenase accessory protein MauD